MGSGPLRSFSSRYYPLPMPSCRLLHLPMQRPIILPNCVSTLFVAMIALGHTITLPLALRWETSRTMHHAASTSKSPTLVPPAHRLFIDFRSGRKSATLEVQPRASALRMATAEKASLPPPFPDEAPSPEASPPSLSLPSHLSHPIQPGPAMVVARVAGLPSPHLQATTTTGLRRRRPSTSRCCVQLHLPPLPSPPVSVLEVSGRGCAHF